VTIPSFAAVACTLTYDLDGLTSAGQGVSDGTSSDVRPSDGDSEARDVATEDAGHDAAKADGAPPSCHGTAGPEPVNVPGTSYCIDSTEVTATQYRDFMVAMGPITTGQPAECAFNTTFAPATPVDADALPIRYVDWCDALAFCKWAGKRLCGQAAFGSPTANTDEWYRACSAVGTQTYPYGNVYQPQACNGASKTDGGLLPAGSQSMCVGTFGNFDMSGNVAEWQNACEPGTGAGTEICNNRGGNAADVAGELGCGATHLHPRSFAGRLTGFRCCSDYD
jgi:sulfatase modifying factor 1